jgi:hypothetical protein
MSLWTAVVGMLVFAQAQASDKGKDADKYAETIKVFRQAGQSAKFFDNSYGYAVFPGSARAASASAVPTARGGSTRKAITSAMQSMNQVTVGLQLGGQVYRQIIFFENKEAFDHFTSGKFEFGAEATAVAITAGASAQASTGGGATAGASATQQDATTAGAYNNGMAVFTVAKGGLMYEASIGGQKFSYKPKK